MEIERERERECYIIHLVHVYLDQFLQSPVDMHPISQQVPVPTLNKHSFILVNLNLVLLQEYSPCKVHTVCRIKMHQYQANLRDIRTFLHTEF